MSSKMEIFRRIDLRIDSETINVDYAAPEELLKK